ncbi:MAG: hypothetical protein AAB930_02270 [Patescibacteria group bacterium]
MGQERKRWDPVKVLTCFVMGGAILIIAMAAIAMPAIVEHQSDKSCTTRCCK